MEKRTIPVSAPMFVGNEKAYVMDCLDSTWISSAGKYVEKFLGLARIFHTLNAA